MSFADPVANFLGNAQTMLVVIFCSLEIVEGRISMAEIATGSSLSCPVADFLGHVFLVVLYCPFEVAEGVKVPAEATISMSYSRPVTDFLGNIQALPVVLYC